MANILAVGATAATSSTVTLADGARANISLMVTTGNIPANAKADVYVTTSGQPVRFFYLTAGIPTTSVSGPCSFNVVRHPGPVFGVDSL